jgi:segregation and condensation protein B
MAMRLVWPERAIMPRKRKASDEEARPESGGGEEAGNGDSPHATPLPMDVPADLESTEPVDGPVEAAPADVEGSASQEPAEPDDDKVIDDKILEALLFSTHHPLTGQRLGELLDVKSQKAIKKAVQALNATYEETGRTFRVEQVAGGYQLLSLPEYGDVLKRLHQKEGDAKLTKAALETLAIIAYKQPILRADIEAIRGVACGETIRSLMEKHLVNIAGRAEEPGRPILYGTTKRFLQLFGLNNLKDLPQSEELPKPKE